MGGARRETPRKTQAGGQEAIARVQVRLRRASPPAACQGPAQRTGRSGDEANSRVPSDEAALCTEELRQRQGAGKGGGALDRAQGIRGGGCRGRARPRSPARAHASPPHLRGGGFPESQWRGTQAASPTPAHVCLGQSGGGQLRHSWDALPRSRARLCAAAEARERRWGAANVGLGTLCLLRDSSGWLWEALLRRDWVFGSQVCITFPAPGAASLPLSFSSSMAVLCRVAAGSAKFQFNKADFSRRGRKPFRPFAWMCSSGVFLARLSNHGPCHQPRSLP